MIVSIARDLDRFLLRPRLHQLVQKAAPDPPGVTTP
jgi:hypothetical protein